MGIWTTLRKRPWLFRSTMLGLSAVMAGGGIYYIVTEDRRLAEDLKEASPVMRSVLETAESLVKRFNIMPQSEQVKLIQQKQQQKVLSQQYNKQPQPPQNIREDPDRPYSPRPLTEAEKQAALGLAPPPAPDGHEEEAHGKLKLTSVADLTSSPQPSAVPVTWGEAKHIEEHIQPVDVHKQVPELDMLDKKGKAADKTKMEMDPEFENRLIGAIRAADERANGAKTAKLRSIQALQTHARALKEAVDSGVAQTDNEQAVWQRAKAAQVEVDNCRANDAKAEAAARAAVEALREVVNESRTDALKAKSPTVRNAIETGRKLLTRLDELNLMVEKEQAQTRVFGQYKQLVEEGRQQWADELKAAFPNVTANRATDGQLSADELNAFIVHASMRIDQLKRQLAEYQSREEQKLAEALEEQRRIDEKLGKLHLDIELRRIRDNDSLELDERVRQERALWESEVEAQLRRAALAHANHLEQVIRTQKQLHDIENTQLIEEATTIERTKYAKQIEQAVGRLNGIEEALNSRTAQDLENRRAKLLWTLSQSLMESLLGGTVEGKPQAPEQLQYGTGLKEVKLIQALAADQDPFVQSVCSRFPTTREDDGDAAIVVVPTERGLKQRAERVLKLARRTAQIDDNGGGPLAYAFSWLQSLFVLRLASAYSPDDQLDLNGPYEPYELLNRVDHFVASGDLASAVIVANLLRGESGQLFRDWLADARLHLEAKFLAELLLAHAQVSSIRTTY